MQRITKEHPNLLIQITPEEEEQTPRESYCIPGITESNSPEADAFVDAVEAMRENHGLWGWCTVHVSSILGPLTGHAYLGCGSYENSDDFKKGGYYEQMLDEALDDLNNQIEDVRRLTS